MRRPLAISFALHAVVVGFAAYGMPRWWREVSEPAPVMMELVTIADETVQKVEEKKQPEPEPEKEQDEPVEIAEKPVPKPPDPKEAAPPLPRRVEAPPPPPAPPAPEAKPEPEPAPPPPEPKPAELKPEPEPKPDPEKTEPERQQFAQVPTPMSKPQLETPEKPEKKFDLNQIQALLDKRQSTESSERVEARKRSADAAPKQQRLATDTQLTMSEIDAIRAQIQRCWSVPAGAREVENMRVQVRVFLRPDGSLERPPELIENMQLSGDGFFRSFAESARRAVQTCSPLQNLPVEKYEQWRELTINFDPKDMLGG